MGSGNNEDLQIQSAAHDMCQCYQYTAPVLQFLLRFWHLLTPDPSPPSMEAIAKLSLLPSHNHKMMTGLWPCGLQESCWQAQSIKEKKRQENGAVCALSVIYCLAPLEQAEVSRIKFLSDLEIDGQSLFSIEDVPVFPGQITVFNSPSFRDFNLF